MTRNKQSKGSKEAEPEQKIKRPQSSYFLWQNDKRAGIKEKNPDKKIGELAKIMGEEWKKISDKEKKKYEDMAAKDKERYEKELKDSGAKPTKAMIAK